MAADTRSLPPCAVLLHGLLWGPLHMSLLKRHLERRGYHVLNIGYPSRKKPIEALVGIVERKVHESLPAASRVDFVGYSMGGLLLRLLLERYRPAKLGRVVHLATPNHGSQWADLLKRFALFKRLYGPAGQQLGTQTLCQLTASLRPIDYALGILAGDSWQHYLGACFVIPGPSDAIVSVESTKLEGMQEHRILRHEHTLFPLIPQVHRHVSAFLEHGRF